MANNRKHQAALGRLYQSEKPGIVEALDPLLSELDARVLAYVESLDAARDAIAEVNRFATACQQPPLVPPPSESLADFHRNFMDWRARTARALHPPTPKPALKVEDYVFVLPS
jgi:hypothetical protein